MELRHLRYFLTVADTRSFTRAAERQNVTQPTLSHQIKQLEPMVGTVLFDRSTKEVELTAARRLFKPYCERILKEIDASALAISELEGLMCGTRRLAVFHSFSHSMLLMSVQRGLGWLIIGAQTFLNNDVMLVTIAVIGAIGIALERQVFTRIERWTVVRWGMVAGEGS